MSITLFNQFSLVPAENAVQLPPIVSIREKMSSMPVVLNLEQTTTQDVINDLLNCNNPEAFTEDTNIEHPVVHMVETPPPQQPLTFAGFGNHSRGKQISLLKKTLVQKQHDEDMDSDDDDDFRAVPLTSQPATRKNKTPMEDPRLVKKARATPPAPPQKKTQVVVKRKILPKPAPPKPAPANQDGEKPCSSAQAKAAQEAAANSTEAAKVAQTTLCQFGNMKNAYKGNTACADACKTPIAREPEMPAADLPRQRLTARRRNPQPIRLRCNIPFQQDLEYVHVKYPGYGRAVMLREVYGGNTICLSFDMMREISRQLRKN